MNRPRINLGTGKDRRSDWSTPDWLFRMLDAEFHFALDACASIKTMKCVRFFDVKQDALTKDWAQAACGGAVYMNPPYGQKELPVWMKKAWETAMAGSTVVCLVPARTDARWWHEFAMKGEVRLIRGRVNFDNGSRKAPFASAVVVFHALGREEVRIKWMPTSIHTPPRRGKYGPVISKEDRR